MIITLETENPETTHNIKIQNCSSLKGRVSFKRLKSMIITLEVAKVESLRNV